MKYEIPTELTGYLPEVLAILSSIEDLDVYNEDKNLSHPADLFLLAFNDVIECTYRLSRRLNEEVNQTRLSKIPPTNLDDIRFDIFNLMFYTANFIEACQSIIKSLFKEGGKDKIFIKAVREFNDSIKNYREHTSKIINLIKHQHRRIRPFSYSWSGNLIIGYFVEGLVSPTVIGPEPQVHPKYKNLNTGISLNRDIPFHIANIYFSSACLASVVKKYTNTKKTTQINPSGDEVLKCLKEIAKIDLFLLPNEFEKKIPSVFERKEEVFLIELASKRKAENRTIHIADISLSSTMGIRNRSIAPPYAIFNDES